jgi:hypothetical protein
MKWFPDIDRIHTEIGIEITERDKIPGKKG